MTLSKKAIFWMLIITVLVIAVAVTYAILRSRSIRKKVALIQQAIDRGVGELGKDIDSVLLNVKADSSYIPSKTDLDKLKSAKASWYWVDHPEYISEVLSGKTKSQIKSIVIAFENAYGVKFNDHLNDIFSDAIGYDSNGYQKIINIVQSAK